MSTGRDDDALSWEGDDDPTLDTRIEPAPGQRSPRETPASSSAAAEPSPVADASDDAQTDDAAPAGGMSNVELVALGVVAATYVLIAVGWLIGGIRLHGVAGFLLAPDGDAPATWGAGNLAAVMLAVVAPAIWFAAVFLLTRRSARWVRWVLLAAGAILLLPWPFIMMGAVGA